MAGLMAGPGTVDLILAKARTWDRLLREPGGGRLARASGRSPFQVVRAQTLRPILRMGLRRGRPTALIVLLVGILTGVRPW